MECNQVVSLDHVVCFPCWRQGVVQEQVHKFLYSTNHQSVCWSLWSISQESSSFHVLSFCHYHLGFNFHLNSQNPSLGLLLVSALLYIVASCWFVSSACCASWCFYLSNQINFIISHVLNGLFIQDCRFSLLNYFDFLIPWLSV